MHTPDNYPAGVLSTLCKQMVRDPKVPGALNGFIRPLLSADIQWAMIINSTYMKTHASQRSRLPAPEFTHAHSLPGTI